MIMPSRRAFGGKDGLASLQAHDIMRWGRTSGPDGVWDWWDGGPKSFIWAPKRHRELGTRLTILPKSMQPTVKYSWNVQDLQLL